jgi:hypothetical protein
MRKRITLAAVAAAFALAAPAATLADSGGVPHSTKACPTHTNKGKHNGATKGQHKGAGKGQKTKGSSKGQKKGAGKGKKCG